MLRVPGALSRSGMDGAVTSFDWSNLLAMAAAGGIESPVALQLLQIIEHRAVMAVNGQGDEDGQ
ncbi:MAG TPA: hypothetical protein DEQ40_16395 [Oxalobacteraceae bacterium]|jgi:hypothetical protein|nr:hypothetical protein [Oxalobacteraceae bacterium]